MPDVMHPLVELFREQGLLDDMQVEEVLQENSKTGKPIAQIIADAGYVDMPTQLEQIALHLGSEVVSVNAADVPPEAVEALSADTARQYQCVPIALYGNTLQVAFVDPLNPEVVDQTGFVTGKEIMPVVAAPAEILAALDKLYPEQAMASGLSDILKELGDDNLNELAGPGADLPDVTQLVDAVPIVKFVNLVLFQAVQDRASDIHFEPFEDEFKIRYRMDGALYEMAPPPKHLALPVTSRLKIMANLNISERRLPQDGRISLNLGGKQIEVVLLFQLLLHLRRGWHPLAVERSARGEPHQDKRQEADQQNQRQHPSQAF